MIYHASLFLILNSFEKTEERGEKLNKKDLLSTNLATKHGYCTQRLRIKNVAILKHKC